VEQPADEGLFCKRGRLTAPLGDFPAADRAGQGVEPERLGIETCPVCGGDNLTREEGCWKCKDCDWSACEG
jgi:hypothetical protein